MLMLLPIACGGCGPDPECGFHYDCEGRDCTCAEDTVEAGEACCEPFWCDESDLPDCQELCIKDC